MTSPDSGVEPDEAYRRLRAWWPEEANTAKLELGLNRKHAKSIDVLHDYFTNVETAQFALYSTDLVPVSGVPDKVAVKLPNLKPEPGAPDFDLAAAVKALTFSSPKKTPMAEEPEQGNNTRSKVYMYNDPMVKYYIKGATVAKAKALKANRSHVLDAQTAALVCLDVTRSKFSFKGSPDTGLDVIPVSWEYEVGNLVRKAAFANAYFKNNEHYANDLMIDISRPTVDATAHDAVDKLLEAYTGPDNDTFTLRVRQAQALRYAAQWARAQLAEKTSGFVAKSRPLIQHLYDATAISIRRVDELMAQQGGGAVTVTASFTDLCL